jgi:TetR/AcrR family transcriptional regulator, repressor of fatR-cypB operon
MARIIDEGKIQRIREATIELVVQNGYGGAAISSIARRAAVAEGYLYRFYSSKHELVTELLYSRVAKIIEKLEYLLSSCSSIKEVIGQLIGVLFKMATDSPEEIKFIHVLMHDYNFQVSDEQRQLTKELCEKVISVGIRNGEVNSSITPEEAYGMVIIYPIEFINLRIKGFFGSVGWTGEEQKRVIEFSINALK